MPPGDTIFFATIFSTILASIFAYHFFKFYKIAGLSNLLGIPAGFAFLAASYTLVNIDLWIQDGTKLDSVIAWISFIVLSYGFSLIAVSYHYKSSEFRDSARLVRMMSYAIIPLMVALGAVFLLTPKNAEMIPLQMVDEYFALFNMIALGYILTRSLKGVLTDGNPKLAYIPAAFALLWLGQFIMFTSEMNESIAEEVRDSITEIIKPEIASLAGLLVFTYALYNHVLRGGRIAKRATA